MRANKADVVVECVGVTIEGLLPSFAEVEGVMKFLFLVSEGVYEVSNERLKFYNAINSNQNKENY